MNSRLMLPQAAKPNVQLAVIFPGRCDVCGTDGRLVLAWQGTGRVKLCLDCHNAGNQGVTEALKAVAEPAARVPILNGGSANVAEESTGKYRPEAE